MAKGMLRSLACALSFRRRQEFLKAVRKATSRFAQKYLTATDAGSVGALSQLVRRESEAEERPHLANCELTPLV